MPTEAIVIDPAKLADVQRTLRKAKRCIRMFRGCQPNGNDPMCMQWVHANTLADEVLAEANALGLTDNGD